MVAIKTAFFLWFNYDSEGEPQGNRDKAMKGCPTTLNKATLRLSELEKRLQINREAALLGGEEEKGKEGNSE